MKKINSVSFYGNYHGLLEEHLNVVHEHFISKNEKQKFIYLAGDSSLDNKYWVKNQVPACNGYEEILEPPTSIPDVSHHLNHLVKGKEYVTVNCSVEATALSDRKEGLLYQDKFIRDNITEEDILIVSIGGNDIALKPCNLLFHSFLVLNKINWI